MSGMRAALRLQCLLVCALPLAAVADVSAAQGAAQGLARCASIAAPDARLACYDALANRPAGVAAGASSPAASSPAASVPVASVPVASPPAASAPAATAPVSAASADDPSQFGLSAIQRHVAVVGPKQERGRIVSLSFDRSGRAIIVLDNGQTWAVTDDDGWPSSGDQVVIKRAALGSFLLTAPSNHVYRVHRIQ